MNRVKLQSIPDNNGQPRAFSCLISAEGHSRGLSEWMGRAWLRGVLAAGAPVGAGGGGGGGNPCCRGEVAVSCAYL